MSDLSLVREKIEIMERDDLLGNMFLMFEKSLLLLIQISLFADSMSGLKYLRVHYDTELVRLLGLVHCWQWKPNLHSIASISVCWILRVPSKPI